MDEDFARTYVDILRRHVEATAGQSEAMLGHDALFRGIAFSINSILADLEPTVPGISQRARDAFSKGYDEIVAKASNHHPVPE